MDNDKKPKKCLARKHLPEIFLVFLRSSWRKSLIKNFPWLLPFLFVNKRLSEELSEVFTQKRKWLGENRDMLSVSFKVLKKHKYVIKKKSSLNFLSFPTFLAPHHSASPTIIYSLNGRLIGVLVDWFSFSDKEKLENLSHICKIGLSLFWYYI